MDAETVRNSGRHGSRKENSVAPPVNPEMIAMNGTIQHSREIKIETTAKAIELLKVFINERVKGAFNRPIYLLFL